MVLVALNCNHRGWHKAWLDRAHGTRDIIVSDPHGSRFQVTPVQRVRGLPARQLAGQGIHQHAATAPEAALVPQDRRSCYAKPTTKALENPSFCHCITEALLQLDGVPARPFVCPALGWFSGLLGKDLFLGQKRRVVCHFLFLHTMVCM